MIKCDICSGPLSVDAGGRSATCKVCGMEHSIERVREMLACEGLIPGVSAVGSARVGLPMDEIAAQVGQAGKESFRQIAQLTLTIARVLDQHFADYDIEYMVEPRTLDSYAGDPAYPIQFVMRRDGRAALAIASATQSAYSGGVRGMISGREACRRAGIPYIAFYTNMPNEPDYVRRRIAAAMNGETVRYEWPNRTPEPRRKKRFWNRWL